AGASAAPGPLPGQQGLLRAGLEAHRDLDALLVAEYRQLHGIADVVVVETTLEPRDALGGVAVDRKNNVAGDDRAVALRTRTSQAGGACRRSWRGPQDHHTCDTQPLGNQLVQPVVDFNAKDGPDVA